MNKLVTINFLFFSILTLSLWSCSKEYMDQGSLSNSESFSGLLLVDSLQIPLLPSNTFIQDVHPETGNILLMQEIGRRRVVFEVSNRGEVLQKFEHPTEGPQNAGRSLLSACYYDEGLALLGSSGYLLFTDHQFKPLKRVKIPMTFNLAAYPGYRHLQKHELDGKAYLVMYYGPDSITDFTTSEYYDAYNLLTLYNPENEEFLPLGQLAEESIFKNGKAHYFLDTRFQVRNGTIKTLLIEENILYTLDPESGETQHQKLPIDDFVLHEGYSLGRGGLDEQSDFREISGIIRSYTHVDGMDLLVYTSGLTQEKRENLAGRAMDQEAWAILREAMPYQYMIIQDGQALTPALPIPSYLGGIALADHEGYLWATQNIENLDNEPEIITLYKLKIK